MLKIKDQTSKSLDPGLRRDDKKGIKCAAAGDWHPQAQRNKSKRNNPLPPKRRQQLPPLAVKRRHQRQRLLRRRMQDAQPPRMQHQSMHAEMLANEPIVIATPMTRIAQQMVRHMMEMPTDLPIAPGLRRHIQQRIALLRIAAELERHLHRR